MSRDLQAVCLLILFISISGCAALMPPPVTYGGYGGYAYPSPQPNSVAANGYYNQSYGYNPNYPPQYNNGTNGAYNGYHYVQPQNVAPGYTPASTPANTPTNVAPQYAPAPPVSSSPSPTVVNQSAPGLKTNSATAANRVTILRVPSDHSAGSTSANTGMKKRLSPAIISGYCLTPQDKKLCVFYRPAKHLGSNNRRRGLFIFNAHTGGMEKHFEDIERLSPTQVDGHNMFVQTLGSSYMYRANLEVLDTQNLKIREISLGEGVPLPWSGKSLSNLNWVDWNLLGWGPHHHFFYVDCLNAAPGIRAYDYFTLKLGRNGVTVRAWAPPWVSHAGGMWTLFGSVGNSARIYVFNGTQRWIFNRRARRVLLLQGPIHFRLIKAGTGKMLATYPTNDVMCACSPDGKQILAPYKIPGVHSRFIAIMQLPKLKILQVIPVNHCTTSASKYIWAPDGIQILIITQQYHNYRKPADGWGITFASAASGKITHFIPLANRIITQFSSNGRYAYVLNLGGKAGSDLLCIDLHNDEVVYKSVLPGSSSIGQKASVIPSPGNVVFVALGHTVFEVNASSGHLLGKFVNMDPYVGHNTISKNGRRIYLATFNKAAKGATGLVAVSTNSGRIVRKFVLPEIHIEIPPKYQGGGDGGAFFGY